MADESNGDALRPAPGEALRQARDRIRKLHEVALQLEEVQDEQQVYDLGIAAADRILNLTISSIDIARDGLLVPRALSSGVPAGGSTPAPTSQGGIMGLTHRNRRTYIIDDVQIHPQADPVMPEYRAMISVPIGDIGVFQCVSTRAGAYTEEDAEMLEILSAHIAAAVRRIRAQHRLEEQRQQAEELASRYEVLLEGTQDGMFLVEPVPGEDDFVLSEANSAFERMIGRSAGESYGVRGSELLPREAWPEIREHLRQCQVSQEFLAFEAELEFRDRIGHFAVHLSPIVSGDETVQIVGSVRERTGEREAQRALAESEMKYRTLVENARDIIVIVQDDRYVYANPALETILGYHVEEVLESGWLELVHEDERRRAERISRARDRGEEALSVYETVMKHRDGHPVHVELNVNVIRYRDRPADLVVVRDVTQRKDAERQLRYLSFHDQLTGLYNRAYFENELARLDVPRQLPLSILMADINSLKLINDVFGHQEGDRLLRRVAGTLREACRQEDVIARMGGDEFAILLPRTSFEQAEDVVGRLRQRWSESGHQHYAISVSIGAATKSEEHEDIWNLFSEAEVRMYRDKMLRRDSVRHSIVRSLRNVMEKTPQQRERARFLQEISIAVGREMDLHDGDLKNLEILAQLHDIGRVSESDAVSLMPGDLDGDVTGIEPHPELGYRIARATRDFAPAAEALLYHREWYNGEGHPHGLSGEEIPILARILAVVDAYQALTHHDPGEQLSEKKALLKLRAGAGVQFDPEVVQALVRVVSADR